LKSNSKLASAPTIRRAGIEDVPAITLITNAAYTKWIPSIGRKPLPMTVDYGIAVQSHMIDLCVVDQKIVALIEMIEEDDHLMIENLALLPQFQGQGLGSKLLHHAEKIALSLGLSMLRLLTNAKFDSNLMFYKRNQFIVDRQEPFMGGTIIHMRKTIV
jgi:GNAT superfamily N-acetyltransferase